MTKVLVTESYLEDIADAIREKKSTLDTYKPSEMADAISSISGGATVLKPFVVRPDAELVKIWSYDTTLSNESINVPSWSTSAVTVRASDAMTGTYTVDTTNYDYYVMERALTIPTYNTNTLGKGRIDYHIGSFGFELVTFPANTIYSLDKTKSYTTQTRAFYATGAYYRSVYWSTATAVTAYSTSAYSTSQIVQAPSISSGGAITCNTPTWSMRGSTSYFTQTYWQAITNIRYQFIAEVYRAPKSNLNIDAWGIAQQADHIFDDAVNTNTHTLT